MINNGHDQYQNTGRGSDGVGLACAWTSCAPGEVRCPGYSCWNIQNWLTYNLLGVTIILLPSRADYPESDHAAGVDHNNHSNATVNTPLKGCMDRT